MKTNGKTKPTKIKLTMEKKKVPSFVRIVIQNENNEYLLVYNKKGGWNFPGGKVERNESPEEAIKRETKEEVNLTIEELEKIAENVFYIDDAWINKEKWRGYFYQAGKYLGNIINKEKHKILEIKFWEKKDILESEEVSDIAKFFLKSMEIKIGTPKGLESTKNE